MPALWENMTVEDRHSVITAINNFEDVEGMNHWWIKVNVMTLLRFAPLAQMQKLRICHMAVTLDPGLIVGGDDVSTAAGRLNASDSESDNGGNDADNDADDCVNDNTSNQPSPLFESF